MDYSSTYFITLLVFTHDKLAEALKQLVKFPWHGVYATPASLIRATKDVMLDISLSHIPAACETRIFVTHIVTAGGHWNFPEKKCLVLHREKVSCSAVFVPWEVFSWEVPPDTIVSRGHCWGIPPTALALLGCLGCLVLKNVLPTRTFVLPIKICKSLKWFLFKVQ